MGTAENLRRKILLTTETTATITMGTKVTAVVSTGARRMGRGEEGRKFFCRTTREVKG
jgi:hypothetical protein